MDLFLIGAAVAAALTLAALGTFLYRALLRDRMAEVALHALICEPAEPGKASVAHILRDCSMRGVSDRFALASYMLADSMLKARKDPAVRFLNEWETSK